MLWLKLPALGTLVLLRHRRGRRLLLLLQLQLLLYQGVLLLPAVPYAVHLDLLPPAVVAAERRVPSAPSEPDRGGIRTHTQRSLILIVSFIGAISFSIRKPDLYMKMSPQSALRQRVHSSRKLLGSSASVSGTQNADGARLAVVGLLPSSAFVPSSVERRGRWACALPPSPETTAARSGLPKAWK